MYPKHPDTIIIKNNFYPKGVREIHIWNYYQKNKDRILRDLGNRKLVVFMIVENNETIVKRYPRLTSANFDEVITGRSVSLHGEINDRDSLYVIDIDSDDLNKSKIAALDCVKFFKSKFNMSCKIIFTGKRAFHIRGYSSKSFNVGIMRERIKEELTTEFRDKYLIDKRSPGSDNINLDLSPMKPRAPFILEGSLSVLGLQCMEIPIRKIKSFTKKDSIVSFDKDYK